MVVFVFFTTTCAIGTYQHKSCEFEPHSWLGVLDTTLYDKVCWWLATGRWFSKGTLVSSTNKNERHDIAEILLKVALNTINLPTHIKKIHHLNHSATEASDKIRLLMYFILSVLLLQTSSKTLSFYQEQTDCWKCS